jgi:hypothetical protein
MVDVAAFLKYPDTGVVHKANVVPVQTAQLAKQAA